MSINSRVILAAMAALLPVTASAESLVAEAQTAADQRLIIPPLSPHPLGDLATNASHGPFGTKLKRTYVSPICQVPPVYKRA